MSWKNNILFKEDTEWIVSLQGLIKIIVRFRAEEILCTFVSCNKHFGAPNMVQKHETKKKKENLTKQKNEQIESLYFSKW